MNKFQKDGGVAILANAISEGFEPDFSASLQANIDNAGEYLLKAAEHGDVSVVDTEAELSNRGTHLSAELYPGFFYEEDGEILDHAMRARYEAGERVELQMVVGPDGQVHQLFVEQ